MNLVKKLVQEIGQRCVTGELPDSYLVLDVETTGFNWHRGDVVVQLGFAAVRDRELVDSGGFYLDPGKREMSAGAAEVTGLETDFLRAVGMQREEAYRYLLPMLQLYRDGNCMFVGHNFQKFDGPFLNYEFEKAGIEFQFDPREVVDTGMFFKATQLSTVPARDETLSAFFTRVADTRSRVKWNLAHAIKHFKVDKIHDINLDDAHDAGVDCRLTHLLLEELRKLGVDRLDQYEGYE